MWVEGEDQNCRQVEVRDHESETSRGYRRVCVWRLRRVNGKSSNSSEIKVGKPRNNFQHIMVPDLCGVKDSEFKIFFRKI